MVASQCFTTKGLTNLQGLHRLMIRVAGENFITEGS